MSEETIQKRLVGPGELAQYLDLSINTVYSWIQLRKIPFFKIGRLPKFDLREIEEWMEEKCVEEMD